MPGSPKSAGMGLRSLFAYDPAPCRMQTNYDAQRRAVLGGPDAESLPSQKANLDDEWAWHIYVCDWYRSYWLENVLSGGGILNS